MRFTVNILMELVHNLKNMNKKCKHKDSSKYQIQTPDGWKDRCSDCQKNPSAVALGKLGGSIKSDKKSQSSRENGKKGGRPKKVLPTK